jgi:hypothetical protein
MNAEQLVTVYIKMRDKRQQLQREFDEVDTRIKAQQDAVAAELLDLCKEMGAEGLRTPAGSVFRTTKTRYWTSDFNSMKEFIKENDAFELLENRIHQTNMKSFIEEHPDKLPPGMNIDSRYSINVRRK